MNLKAELKMLVLHEHGVRADDMLDGATKRSHAHDGAKQALRTMAKNIAQLAAVVDKDLEDGKLVFDNPLAVAAYAKLMVDRAVQGTLNAAHNQENLQISVGGEITAYTALVAAIEKDMRSEQAKLEAQQHPPEDRHVVGTHPLPSIAAQRRAEEAPPPEVTTNGVAVVKNGKRRGKKKAS
jgi:hypothetical protein